MTRLNYSRQSYDHGWRASFAYDEGFYKPGRKHSRTKASPVTVCLKPAASWSLQKLDNLYLSQINVGAHSECWEWQGATVEGSKYPTQDVGSKYPISVRTVVYEAYMGRRKTKGEKVYMTCKNAGCLNPSHFERRIS